MIFYHFSHFHTHSYHRIRTECFRVYKSCTLSIVWCNISSFDLNHNSQNKLCASRYSYNFWNVQFLMSIIFCRIRIWVSRLFGALFYQRKIKFSRVIFYNYYYCYFFFLHKTRATTAVVSLYFNGITRHYAHTIVSHCWR